MLVEFSIKAVRLIVPPVQLGGTRERIKFSTAQRGKTCQQSCELGAQSPASCQSPSTAAETQTIELF